MLRREHLSLSLGEIIGSYQEAFPNCERALRRGFGIAAGASVFEYRRRGFGDQYTYHFTDRLAPLWSSRKTLTHGES